MLKAVDPALAAQLQAEQAELAAAPNQLDEEVAAEPRAPARGAVGPGRGQQGGRHPGPAGRRGVGAVPHGGSIEVAGDISEPVERLLTDAAEAGITMCGNGYRDPAAQIACAATTAGPASTPSGRCPRRTAAHRRLVRARRCTSRPGDRLHRGRGNDRLRERGVRLVEGARGRLRTVQPAERTMALVDQRQLTTGTWLRRVLAVVLTVAALTPSIGGAQQPDPGATEQERDEVRSRQAEVVIEIDALEAQDAEVRATLAEIERNVARQRSELQAAERAQAQGEAELAQATQAVADAQQRIDDLNVQADRLVVDPFVNPPSDYALEPLRAGSMTDAAVIQAVLKMQGKETPTCSSAWIRPTSHSLPSRQRRRTPLARPRRRRPRRGNSTTWRPHLANSRPSPRTSRSA